MIIDLHAHLWDQRFEECKCSILKACNTYNISKIYVSSLGSLNPDTKEIGHLNLATHRFMQEEPGLVGGFCYVNPLHISCIDELRRGVEDYGMSGLKLWVATFCDDPLVYPLAEQCIKYEIPILLHVFRKASGTGQLKYESLGVNAAGLASRYPELKIVMAHLGGNCYTELKPIRKFPNISVDISGTIFRRDDLDYSVKMLGVDRIIFGTDMPDASFFVNYGQVQEATLSEGEKELILFGNAKRLFKR